MKPLILIAMLSQSLYASSIFWDTSAFTLVDWGGIVMDDLASRSYTLYYDHIIDGWAPASSQMGMVVKQTSERTSWYLYGDLIDVGYGSTLMVATPGDIVSKETIFNPSTLFLTNVGEDCNAVVTYNANETQSLYFGFQALYGLTVQRTTRRQHSCPTVSGWGSSQILLQRQGCGESHPC